MVKIHIPDKKQSADALLTLSGRGRVDCYADDVYMVPEPALAVLRDRGISFQELGRGGIDYAGKTLGDTLAGHVQRRAADRAGEAVSDAG